ncbi:hypothetical protein C7H84_07325 [Burkholderia sp. Nafp2/4-1b]|uniref:hypothetical protein n=1 Tax=Burkholderia sp. Nafp2/4-1b TaxID=2116686 RepID=UPI000EF89915|nr:hypothetical protein [Burkholderia sp. Nafp2/4-1b]RKU04046.1 hypothetical protein C7H84_07325 [Burkholderia sp. Nafp2/4-1b]
MTNATTARLVRAAEQTTMNEQGRALYVCELLHELGMSAQDEVSLRHPMMFGEIVGRDRVERLAAAAESVFAEIEPQHAWSGADIGGREWHGRFQDRVIRGVTVARRSGTCIQVDIFLGSFPAPVRRALYDASRDLVDADAWVLPAGISTALPPIPDDEVLDAKLPFGITDEMFLTSPVACKPIRGRADVERVCGHSIAVYGGRASGPRLSAGATTLSLWTGEVGGLPLEVANVICWEDARNAKGMAMAMRPWPVVALFQARMQARTLSFLDPSYFESDAESESRDGVTPPQFREV